MPLRGAEKYNPEMGPKHPIPRNALGGEAIWPFHLQYWLNVLAADDNYYVNGVALPTGGGATWLASDATKFDGANTKGAGVPDYARNVTAVCSDVQTGDIVVTGIDVQLRPRTETITLSGATPVAGKVAFKEITSIAVPVKAGSETIKIGFGDVLGLDSRMAINTVFKELSGNSYPAVTPVATAGTFVEASAAANSDRNGTYDPNASANGTIDFAVIYIPTERM